MSGVQPESVDGFKEYGTKLANGGSVSTSKRKGHLVSSNDAKKVNIKSFINTELDKIILYPKINFFLKDYYNFSQINMF